MAKDKSPTVRLATRPGSPADNNIVRAATPTDPTVRLAHQSGSQCDNNIVGHKDAPVVRLAHCPGAQGDNQLVRAESPAARLSQPSNASPSDNNIMRSKAEPTLGVRGHELVPASSAPALLVSFVYLKGFLRDQDRYIYRDWVLDSGAFSAHASGTNIDLQEYIDTCLRLKATDPTLVEVFALDVIGDWKASLKNCEAMWAAGVEAIPCYHVGEPESVLLGIAKDYPKIALGGCVGYTKKIEWATQCFSRVWPKKIHGFGFGSSKALMALPWHSVDATNWEGMPCRFGRWSSYNGAHLQIRGSDHNLRSEIEYYLKMERQARSRWANEMAILAALPDTAPGVPNRAVGGCNIGLW